MLNRLLSWLRILGDTDVYVLLNLLAVSLLLLQYVSDGGERLLLSIICSQQATIALLKIADKVIEKLLRDKNENQNLSESP
jgi:hypothetical protein